MGLELQQSTAALYDVQTQIACLKENVNQLQAFLDSFQHLTPQFIREEIEKIRKNMNNNLMHAEESFLSQKSILADHLLSDGEASPEVKRNLRDKSFNSLHGAIGDISNTRDGAGNLKSLLDKHQHFIAAAAIANLETIFNNLNKNLEVLEECTDSQTNLIHHIIENPKKLSQINKSTMWRTEKSEGRTPYLNNQKSNFTNVLAKVSKESKPKVLIVDDGEMNRTMLANFLKGDYECHFAVDGNDAIAKHRAIKSDIILMDILMPNKDGLEAAAEIRQQEEANASSKVVIIAVTANADDFKNGEIYKAGMNDCLRKPFKRADIQQKVAQWINCGNNDVENLENYNQDKQVQDSNNRSIRLCK